MNLETEKSLIEGKLKLLPAPPEDITRKLKEQESLLEISQGELHQEREAMETLREELDRLKQEAQNREQAEETLQREKAELEEQLKREKQILSDRLIEKEETRRRLQTELETEKEKPWWRKLFGG